MNTQQLAALMGVSESDAQGFVDCLRVWTDKGFSVEQAIEKNIAAWGALLANANEGANNSLSIHRPAFNALADFAVDAFYPQQVAA